MAEATDRPGLTDACAALGHPGATYNPWLNKTWCACGDVVRVDGHGGHVTCCGGPLDRFRTRSADGEVMKRAAPLTWGELLAELEVRPA